MALVTVEEACKSLPDLLAAAESGERVEIEGPTGRVFRLTGRSPLREGADGVLLVGDTAISLEEVLLCHKAGSPPEDIVACYDALRLADVYAAIAYYLDHREEVDAYLARREHVEAAERRRVEEAHALSNEELLELARRHPAPQEWYDQEGKPF